MNVIHLISGPRNISTAMMYAFGERHDLLAIDEPFYAYYLTAFGIDYHPGTQDILESQSSNPLEVLENIRKQSEEKTIFLKDMAHHLKGFDLSWMKDMKTIFLIRDVKRLINSFSKVIPEVSLEDIGIKREWELYQYLLNQGVKPIVVDANEVLKNPSKILQEICNHCALPYEEGMMTWTSGPKVYDGVWAPHWYSNVHKSTHFGTPYLDEVLVDLKYESLYREAKTYYSDLLSNSIRA